MALRGIEGWDGYAVGLTGAAFENIFVDKWPGTTGMDQSRIDTDSDRYTSEQTWEPRDPAGGESWVFELTDNPEIIACGLYFKSGLQGYQRDTWWRLLGVNNGSAVHVLVEMSGRDLRIRLNNDATTAATISNIVEPLRWNLIELKAKVHDTTGYWYLYVNGIEVGSQTDIDTKYSTLVVNQIRIYGQDAYNDIGDFYCADEVLGPFHIQGVLPDANGDDSDWTPSGAGANYTHVDEETANESDYVETGATNQDLYNYEDLTGTWDTIFGLQINTRLYLDAAGSETVAVLCLSNVTLDSDNVTVANTTMGSGDENKRVLELDPDTSAAWLSTAIDAAQFGVKFI